MSGDYFGFLNIKAWIDATDPSQVRYLKCTQCNIYQEKEGFDEDAGICGKCRSQPPDDLPKTKKCDKCRSDLPRRLFGGRRHDWHPQCLKYTTCVFCEAKAEDAQWTKRQEGIKQRLADDMREREESWWRENADKVAQWTREYSFEGIVDKLVEDGRQREAAEIRATPPWADHKKIAAIYEEAARITKETGIPHHVDHIVPLQGPVATWGPFKGMRIVFGLHWEANLRVIPARENVIKGNRTWPNMPEEERVNGKILRRAA